MAAYHADVEFPVVRLLVCDDAPQFTLVTEELALCWVHEGRHYKKLMRSIPYHQARLAAFVQRFWTYYDQLLAYWEQPTPKEATRLVGEFETLFITVTDGDEALDERITKTRTKKSGPLMVLVHPEIPRQYNPAQPNWQRAPGCANGTWLRAAHSRGRHGLGHVHDARGDRDQTGESVSITTSMTASPAPRTCSPLADPIVERAKVLNLGASSGIILVVPPLYLKRFRKSLSKEVSPKGACASSAFRPGGR